MSAVDPRSAPEPTRLIAIRHGETAWNVDSRIQGHLDIPLNDTGLWQARRLAQALSGETLAAIYSSDLSRARQTAEALAAPSGVPVQPDAALRERCFGVFEGLSFADVRRRWPDQAERWRRRDPAFEPEGGESLEDFYARVVAVVQRLAAAHRGQNIAVVAHGGVLDCLYRAAARVDLRAPRTWALANASVNRLLYADAGLVLVGWADCSHLEVPTLDDTLGPDRRPA